MISTNVRLQAILKSAPSKAKRKELAMMQDNYGSLGRDGRLWGPYKWPYKLVTGVLSLLVGVVT